MTFDSSYPPESGDAAPDGGRGLRKESPGLDVFPSGEPLTAYDAPITFSFADRPDYDTTEMPAQAAVAAPARPAARRRRWLREVLETVVLAAAIFLLVRGAVQNFRVEGSSMDPSLDNGQYLLVNKAVYCKWNLECTGWNLDRIFPFLKNFDGHIFHPPQRGDVVVFRFPQDPERDFIKRVVGIPGDTVEVRDGTVFINGRAAEENFILERPRYNYGPVKVPEGQYFVLGDNRNNSYDSHVWGMLPEEYIIGKAWVSYWPLSEFGLVNNTKLKPADPVATEAP
jgi:signal peptidase I